MSLLTIAELRAVVTSGLDDPTLQAIIDDEEAEITRRFGVTGDGASSRVELHAMRSARPSLFVSINLFVHFPILSLTSIRERRTLQDDFATLAATAYLAIPEQGRIVRTSGVWGELVEVTYIPTDQRAKVKRAVIELVRLAISQTAMQAESVAGEYSYTAPPNWEVMRARAYQRIGFMRLA